MLNKQEKSSVVSVIKTKKSEVSTGGSFWSVILRNIQEFGKSLQYPIAILPFCAILLRLGNLGETYSTDADGNITNQIGYWCSHIFTMPGSVAFDNMALFFGIGVAFGLAKDHRGEAALVGALFYMALNLMLSEGGLATLIYQHVLTKKVAVDVKADPIVFVFKSQLLYVITHNKDHNVDVSSAYVLSVGVLGGVISGAITAFIYNRYRNIALPKALSFFGGRRFIPMLAVVIVIPTAFFFALVWPWIQFVLLKFGQLITPTNPAIAIPGIGLYSLLNRLLLPFGLHQVLNTFFWFQLPETGDVISPNTGATGASSIVNGDIAAFNAGIAGAGLFQSGFFPIMMGGLPAAAAAMIMAAPKGKRKEVSGFLGGVAGVAFLCGITEPIEFSFVFIAPALYGIHACLTAVFNMIVVAMRIQLGFSFSAGFIDFAVSIPQSWGFSVHNGGIFKLLSNPLMIVPLIAAAAAVYYFVFYFWIIKFDIKTPGREELIEGGESSAASDSGKKINVKEKYSIMAQKLLDIVGADNVETVDNCATRLRLQVKDSASIDEAKVKATGVFGMKRLGKNSVQIIVGPDVEHVANAFEGFWQSQKVSK